MDWCPTHSPNNTAGNSFKSHRYQSIRTHDWKMSWSWPIDPEIAPADLGPLVVATQQSVLKQLRERLEVLHASAALKQQQSDLTNDTQFKPNLWGEILRRRHGNGTRFCERQGAFTNPDGMAHMKLKLYATAVWPQLWKGSCDGTTCLSAKSFKSTQNK